MLIRTARYTFRMPRLVRARRTLAKECPVRPILNRPKNAAPGPMFFRLVSLGWMGAIATIVGRA
jgi:hypothetical protein